MADIQAEAEIDARETTIAFLYFHTSKIKIMPKQLFTISVDPCFTDVNREGSGQTAHSCSLISVHCSL